MIDIKIYQFIISRNFLSRFVIVSTLVLKLLFYNDNAQFVSTQTGNLFILKIKYLYTRIQ